MQPGFEKYAGDRKTPKDSVTFRLPAHLKNELELIAEFEDDSLSGLLIEGVGRVLEERRRDPSHESNLEQQRQARIEDLRTQLAQIQAEMEIR
jgi:hypothetical protein